MAVSENDVVVEFKKAIEANPVFVGLLKNDQLVKEVVAVSVFLGNGPNTVDGALKKLNQMMESKVDVVKAMKQFEGNEKFYLEEKDRSIKLKKDPNCAKLLSNLLFVIEEQAGFTHQKPPGSFAVWKSSSDNVPLSKEKITPTSPYMAGVASWKTFQSQLYSKEHWKDVGVPSTHGEFTHRIQWALVSLQKIVPNPGMLMRELAGFPPVEKLQASALWDALFDRLRQNEQGGLFHAVDDSDFRSPENFQAYLCSDLTLKKIPLLSLFLRARKAKREGNLLLPDYVALKTFGRPMSKLNPTEEKVVQNILEDKKPGDAMMRQKASA